MSKFSIINVIKRNGPTVSGYWMQDIIGTLEDAKTRARDTNKVNSHALDIAVVDQINSSVPVLLDLFTNLIDLSYMTDTTWVTGLGECYGKRVDQLRVKDIIYLTFQEPETVSEIVKVVGGQVTFTTSWKDVNGKSFGTIYEKPQDEIIACEFDGQGPLTTERSLNEYLQTKNKTTMIKTESTKAFKAKFEALKGKQKDMENTAVLASVLKKVKNDKTLQKLYDNLEDFIADFDEVFKDELAKVKSSADSKPASKKTEKKSTPQLDPWEVAVNAVKDEKTLNALLKEVAAKKKTIVARRGDIEVTYDPDNNFKANDRLVVVFKTEDGEIRKSYVDAFKRFFQVK